MKEYYRQAPILYHLGKKDMSKFYLLPRNLMEPIFNQLNGKQGNQIKLMSLLIGTMGDGSFAITEKWVCDRTGMTQSGYNRARKALIDRGWLRLERGMLYVDFDAICRPEDCSADMSSKQEACADRKKATCHDSRYNKKLINKKIINDFESSKETGRQAVSDPISEYEVVQHSIEEHKEDFEWIDDALRYEEYVLESVAAAKEQEREELLCDEPFDLDSILDGMIIVEKVESCHQEYGRDKTAG